MGITIPPISFIHWRKSWRIIPSRFPPIDLFERVASPDEWEYIVEIEGLTNPRLREEIGDLSLIPVEDRVFGEGSSWVMAPFTHLNPGGSRFSDGSWGVYYTAYQLETAIAETKFHREKFMRATNEPPMHLDMRVIVASIKGEVHDILGKDYRRTELYSLDSYTVSQGLGRRLKNINSFGVVYWSVRQLSGQNVAVFKPKIISRWCQERHLEYVWDGQHISFVFEKKLV